MKIFLDDIRIPTDCIEYMGKRIGKLTYTYLDYDWNVVRNYPEFVKVIDKFKGKITHISFDHDLADGHYHKNMQKGVINYNSEDFNSDDFNKTGFHAAKYFKQVYDQEKLEYPVLFVHSMNPVGTENIVNLFKK
jgi:hypothetical protein